MEPGRYIACSLVETKHMWIVGDTEDDDRILTICEQKDDAELIRDALNAYEPARTKEQQAVASRGEAGCLAIPSKGE